MYDRQETSLEALSHTCVAGADAGPRGEAGVSISANIPGPRRHLRAAKKML